MINIRNTTKDKANFSLYTYNFQAPSLDSVKKQIQQSRPSTPSAIEPPKDNLDPIPSRPLRNNYMPLAASTTDSAVLPLSAPPVSPIASSMQHVASTKLMTMTYDDFVALQSHSLPSPQRPSTAPTAPTPPYYQALLPTQRYSSIETAHGLIAPIDTTTTMQSTDTAFAQSNLRPAIPHPEFIVSPAQSPTPLPITSTASPQPTRSTNTVPAVPTTSPASPLPVSPKPQPRTVSMVLASVNATVAKKELVRSVLRMWIWKRRYHKIKRAALVLQTSVRGHISQLTTANLQHNHALLHPQTTSSGTSPSISPREGDDNGPTSISSVSQRESSSSLQLLRQKMHQQRSQQVLLQPAPSSVSSPTTSPLHSISPLSSPSPSAQSTHSLIQTPLSPTYDEQSSNIHTF